jgi:uncharacterized protein involved in exopolysaccharide biosynthesis
MFKGSDNQKVSTSDKESGSFFIEDEFDFLLFLKAVRRERRLVFLCTLTCVLVGLVFAFGTKTEYTAYCKLMPETAQSVKMNFGSLGGLAGLAGINMPNNEISGLSPDVYPQIVKSTPFQIQLINENIHYSSLDTTISSEVYFDQYYRPSLVSQIFLYTLKLPWTIKKMLSSDQENGSEIRTDSAGTILNLSNTQYNLIKEFRNRVRTEVDPKSQIITIEVKMPDKMASAQLTDAAVRILTNYLVNYRITKARDNHRFIKERYDESKLEFEASQQRLAGFSDRNRNVVTASARIEQQKLQNEYDIVFEVYKGLAAQLEQAEIKIKEETPVFTILEPARVPTQRSSPKRTLILIVALIAGVFLSTSFVFFSAFLLQKSTPNEP